MQGAGDGGKAVPRDIVAAYPQLVGPFALFNIMGWTFCLLEVWGAVGGIGYTIMDGTYPIDIAFCQLMFWGTLHYGPIPDGRLALICRVAFCGPCRHRCRCCADVCAAFGSECRCRSSRAT